MHSRRMSHPQAHRVDPEDCEKYNANAAKAQGGFAT